MKKISQRRKKWIERTVDNDRTYKLFLYNRFYLFALFVLLQLAGFGFLLYLFAYNSRVGVIVQSVVGILSLVFVLDILNKDDRPSSKLSWILLILIIPVFGVPFYMLFGEGRPARYMRKRLAASEKQNAERRREILGERAPCAPVKREEGASYYLHSYADHPPYYDGEVTYYDCGEKAFPEMLTALRSAKKYILVEYFIVAHGKMWGEMLKILLEKATEGVQVRIIYDDFGCMTTLPPRYDEYLSSLHENIRAMAFNEVVPVFALRMNNRDHRKILVVDGKVGFTGGINLADEYIGEKTRFGKWKDSAVRVTGGAVNSFIETFFGIWNAFSGQAEDIGEYLLPLKKDKRAGALIQPYDDSPLDGKSVAESVYVDMINRAVRYVYIFTPYLLLDDLIRVSLCRAAERGVDVRIVTPGIPDKKMIYRLTRANYPILLKAGVKIYEYTPGFLHSKSLVCDDESAVVGTINFDYRSLYFHFENAVYFSGVKAVAAVKKDAEETFPLCKLCTLENTRRGLVGKMVDSLLRVFETLM